jgi:hypothetical protein
VNETSKSKLKSVSSEDAHANVHPIRRLYAWSLSRAAREIAVSATSWFSRWTAKPSKPSAIDEQAGQPAVHSGPNMKW